MAYALMLVLVAAALWGTTGTAAFWLGAEASPLAIGAATMGVGGVILAVTGGSRTLGVVREREGRLWLVLGALGVIVYPLTFYSGMALTGISIGNVIALGLGPITVAVLEWLVDRSRPSFRWWIVSGFALVGIALMASADVELGGNRPSDVPLGVTLAVAAGLSYGLFTYAFGRLIGLGHHPRGVIGAVFGAASPVLLVVVVVTGTGLLSSLGQLSLISYLVLGPMVLAYLAFSRALVTLRSSTVATAALVEPLVAAFLALLVVGEQLSAVGLFGAAIVLVSLIVLALGGGERARHHSAYS